MKRNLEAPRRGFLLLITPVAALVAAFMFFFFASDQWTVARAIFQICLTAVALGLAIATVAPRYGWLGIRFVTFTISLAWLSLLIHDFWFTQAEFVNSTQQTGPTSYNAVFGFVVFGVPCLIYTLWGSTEGRIGYIKEREVTRTDLIVFIVAKAAQVLLIVLSAAAAFAGIWRIWMIS